MLGTCKYVQPYWNHLEEYIKQNFELKDTLDFDAINRIFNTVHPVKTHLVNFLVLLAKQVIYRSRCEKKILNINVIIEDFFKLHSYELYYAKQNNKLFKHAKKLPGIINDNFISEYLDNAM